MQGSSIVGCYYITQHVGSQVMKYEVGSQVMKYEKGILAGGMEGCDLCLALQAV